MRLSSLVLRLDPEVGRATHVNVTLVGGTNQISTSNLVSGCSPAVVAAEAVRHLCGRTTDGHRCAPSVRADPVDTTAVVLKVVDGDTVDIRDDVRGRLRIRLLGIDTPGTKKPGYTVGCWGPEATEFAKSTLLDQRVALIYDESQGVHDRYGRTLAYLDKADGWDYSTEAARAGVAHAYIYHDKPAERYPAIAAAEQEAKSAIPVSRTKLNAGQR